MPVHAPRIVRVGCYTLEKQRVNQKVHESNLCQAPHVMHKFEWIIPKIAEHKLNQ